MKNWLLVHIYDPARNEITEWPLEIRKDLGSILTKLQKREKVGMPDVRTMPSIAKRLFGNSIKRFVRNFSRVLCN